MYKFFAIYYLCIQATVSYAIDTDYFIKNYTNNPVQIGWIADNGHNSCHAADIPYADCNKLKRQLAPHETYQMRVSQSLNYALFLELYILRNGAAGKACLWTSPQDYAVPCTLNHAEIVYEQWRNSAHPIIAPDKTYVMNIATTLPQLNTRISCPLGFDDGVPTNNYIHCRGNLIVNVDVY